MIADAIFPKIPTAEEIARLIREAIGQQLREMYFAGAMTGFFAGFALVLLVVFLRGRD